MDWTRSTEKKKKKKKISIGHQIWSTCHRILIMCSWKGLGNNQKQQDTGVGKASRESIVVAELNKAKKQQQ